MIDKCMINSYKVMTFKSTIEEILDEDNKAMFYGNPLDYTTEDIDEVIEYFENTEEYEKCGELLEENMLKSMQILIFSYTDQQKVTELLTTK